MRKIDDEEMKNILLQNLAYFDNLCRNNNIKYTLIGGSLIGAIREKGFIKWDDDIDIILEKKEYDKFLQVMSTENGNYFLFDFNFNKECPFSFSKLVDKRTKLKVRNRISINNYGISLDLFENHNTSNFLISRYIHFFRVWLRQVLANGYYNNSDKHETGLKRFRTSIAKKIGIEKILQSYNKIIKKYDNKDTSWYIMNNVLSGYKKNVMKKELFNDYIDVKFENMNVMVIKNYDEYLTMVFGDYMTPPSNENKQNHGVEAFITD